MTVSEWPVEPCNDDDGYISVTHCILLVLVGYCLIYSSIHIFRFKFVCDSSFKENRDYSSVNC